MRLGNKSLSFIVNFLLGVAWATLLLGASSAFLTFYSISILSAIVASVVAMIPGMVIILLLEHFITSREKYMELKKQTVLLEEIVNK